MFGIRQSILVKLLEIKIVRHNDKLTILKNSQNILKRAVLGFWKTTKNIFVDIVAKKTRCSYVPQTEEL